MVSVSYVRKQHSIGLNQYHLEWCPKYRYHSLRKERTKEIAKQSFYETAQKYDIVIHSLAIEDDHVHLFVSLPFSLSPAKAVQLLKGRSAHTIFSKMPNFRLRYWNGNFWSPGSFIRSISNVTSGAIKNYIENQDHEKLNGTIKSVHDEANQLHLFDS